MKYKLLRLSLLSMLLMFFGGLSFADQVTMKYSGTTTANMTGENDASLFGLDADAWSVVGNKGANSNMPGLNKAGDFRLYWSANGGNTITVQSLAQQTISKIAITFTGASYSNVSVTVDGNAVTGTDGVFDINSTSFVLGNANTSNTQVRISEIVITYGEAGQADKRIATTIELSGAPTTAEVGATIALPTAVVKAGDATVEGATVTWSSANEAVAIIDGAQIKALAAGTVKITATYDGDETNYKGSTTDFTLTVTAGPYTSIAAMLADITSTHTPVIYQFENLLVTYVNGQNTFVSDGRNGFLFYGANLGLAEGSTYTGSVIGDLYTYNGLPEIAASADGINARVVSEGNLIAWPVIAPADLQNYINVPVTINNAVFVEAGTGKNLTFKVGDENVAVYNQWSIDVTALEADKAYTLKGIGSVYSKNETTTYQLYLASFEEATTPEPVGFRDIKADLTQLQALATESNVYITVAEDGTISQTDNAEEAAATLKGKWHGTSYGWSNFTASVPVEGCVKITYATHDYGNDIVVTNSEGNEVAKFNTQGAKWSSDHSNVVVAYYRTNEPTTLNFSNANYNPYFAVEAIDEADLPTEMTKYTITFAAGEGATGIAPAAIELEAGNKFTAPVNYTLYKEGYTLIGWEAGDAVYQPGQEITPEADMTLTAKYAENEVSLANRTEAVTITYELSGYNDNPKYNIERTSGIIVTQATVDGKTIDVKADVDATATDSKFAHNGSGWHMVNAGTKMTVPSAKDAIISVSTYDDETATSMTFAGNAGTADNKVVSYTATADDATCEIAQVANNYWNKLTIALPTSEEEPGEEPTVVFSWEGNADGAIVSGGTVTAADNTGTDITATTINVQTGSLYVIKVDGKKDFSTNIVTITLENELKAGDKIAITACRNKDAASKKSGLLAKFDKGGQINTATTGLEFVNINAAVEGTDEYATAPNTLEYEVPEAAAGSKVISMTRAETATNLWISKLVITSGKSSEEPGEEPGEEPIDEPHDPVVLTWDYTEANIPTTGPDNGLYYASYVNDAAGTNNGMHGAKLNSSGYAYFAKPAVAGTLTLTIGNRKTADAFAVNVYSCTIADGVATKGSLIGEVAVDASPGTGSIEIDKTVTGIYIERKTSAEGVLSKIVFKEIIPRTFVDFEITNAQLSGEFDASTLPEGVLFTGTQRNDSHGYGNVTLVIPVDGTVKFTIGGCQYANPATCKVTNAEGEVIAEPNLKTAKCYHEDGTATTYLYTGKATTLTFSNIAYLPYFKAEATEVSEATITYLDQDGKKLGEKVVYEGEAIGEVPYTEADLTIAEGMKFRGWIYTNNVKVQPTDVVTGNVTVKASVTAIESVSVGSIQTYDLTVNTFYPEDHETIDIAGGKYYNNHGWDFAADGTITVDVAGNAQIILTLCQYGNGTTIKVTDAEGNIVKEDVPAKAESDGGIAVVQYQGEATKLTFTFAAQTYLHKVTVYNVKDFLTKDEQSGYYIVPAGDAASLIMALNSAASEEGAKVFLPNGTYDLGETVKTAVSGKNVSIIGQSAEGTIIVNHPSVAIEGLDKADLLKNSAEGLYMQDLTLKNDMAYSGNDGRAATLHDVGTKTINKNVIHLSHQDTYYSNKTGGLYYFEGGEIHGTVDYLCGDGRVYFNEVTLVNEQRSSATITANSELYVFNNCTVENNANQYNLGRAWSNNPVCIWLNTTLKDGGEKLIDTRWNLKGINCDYSIAGEYGTKNAAGEDITPQENTITFSKANTTLNTILSAEQAATYTIDYTLGDWAATAQQQTLQIAAPDAQFENGNIVWQAVEGATAYAIFKNDMLVAITTETSLLADDTETALYTIRSANARGGFGLAAEVTGKATGIETMKAGNNSDAIYNLQGIRVDRSALGTVGSSKGIYIVNGKKVIR